MTICRQSFLFAFQDARAQPSSAASTAFEAPSQGCEHLLTEACHPTDGRRSHHAQRHSLIQISVSGTLENNSQFKRTSSYHFNVLEVHHHSHADLSG